MLLFRVYLLWSMASHKVSSAEQLIWGKPHGNFGEIWGNGEIWWNLEKILTNDNYNEKRPTWHMWSKSRWSKSGGRKCGNQFLVKHGDSDLKCGNRWWAKFQFPKLEWE